MKIAVISDTTWPQVNGVAATLRDTRHELKRQGHWVKLIGPRRFLTVPVPFYPEVKLALLPEFRLTRVLDKFNADAHHIATEGPVGLAARRYCLSRGIPFTTSYHTKFPEYLSMYAGVPADLTYWGLRRFHAPAEATMVPTTQMLNQLAARRFDPAKLKVWSRGINTDIFKPGDKSALPYPGPVMLYFGRVAKEKGIEDFLALKMQGTKVVVGDGPERKELARRFPEAKFLGYRFGAELARTVAAADVSVFTSKTDTFGRTMVESLACGVPVATYPEVGAPIMQHADEPVGAMRENLGDAIEEVLSARPRPEACRAHVTRHFSLGAVTRQFASYLVPRQGMAPG